MSYLYTVLRRSSVIERLSYQNGNEGGYVGQAKSFDLHKQHKKQQERLRTNLKPI